MSEQIISIERIQALATAAWRDGKTVAQACPWPAESPAGQAFAQAYELVASEVLA